MADAKRGTVVMISTVHWSSTWQRHHHIASGLLKKNYDVIFIEPLPKRWPQFSEWGRLFNRLMGIRRGAGTCPQNEIPGIRFFSPRLLPDARNLASQINRYFLLPNLARKIRDAVGSGSLIVINYLPTPSSLNLQTFLFPDLSVYDCASDWAYEPYSKKLEQFESKLLKYVDLVFADSPHNVSRLQLKHAHVMKLEGGVDYERFAIAQRLRKSTGQPICAFYGDIGVHADIDLLAQVSHRYPLRLIGPVRQPLHGFSATTQICGPVPYDRVPDLLQDADILLLAYRRSARNRTILPAKTFECLATGKPTVVIGLSDLKHYSHLFYMSQDEKEFFENIAKAATEDSSVGRERIRFAKENTWDKRMEEIDRWLREFLKRKTQRK